MRYLAFILPCLMLIASCAQKPKPLPNEVLEGINLYKPVLGTFNFEYKEEKSERNGQKINQLHLIVTDCSIIDQSDLESVELFCSGLAYHIYISLSNPQLEQFQEIKITSKSRLAEVTKEYPMEMLRQVNAFDLENYEYFEHVAKMDIPTMYNYMDLSVKNDVDYENFEALMMGGFEYDSPMTNIELAGFGYFTDSGRMVLHLRYVLVYESKYNRRHSLYFLTDDNNFLIDGFQL